MSAVIAGLAGLFAFMIVTALGVLGLLAVGYWCLLVWRAIQRVRQDRD